MIKWVDKVKKVLVMIITIMIAIVLLMAVVDLGYILVKDILSPPMFILSVTELLDLFGLFLLVLIGIELLETMEIYIKENVVHVEVVFTVALIAVARKVIILDIKKYPSATLFSLGFIILALAVGYFLIQKGLKIGEGLRHNSGADTPEPVDESDV
jgi:uncharacterized membrane protein (DUF373 family)